MVCSKCKNPLRVIKGGSKSEEGTNKIKVVHVFGCLNPDCDFKMIEQARTEVEQDSFNE